MRRKARSEYWRIVGFGTFSSLKVRRRTDKSAVELRAWFSLRKVSIHAILLTKLCSYDISRYELLFCLQCWYSRLTQISLSTSVSRLKFRYFPVNFLFLSHPILASFERMWFQDKIVKQIPLNVVSLTWATDCKALQDFFVQFSQSTRLVRLWKSWPKTNANSELKY